jgi:hypothetical protein
VQLLEHQTVLLSVLTWVLPSACLSAHACRPHSLVQLLEHQMVLLSVHQ